MKRTLTLLALCLLLLCSCSDEKRLIGTWVGEYSKIQENFTTIEMEQTLDLFEDGSYTYTRELVFEMGTWELLESDSIKFNRKEISSSVSSAVDVCSYFLDGDELWVDDFFTFGDIFFTEE